MYLVQSVKHVNILGAVVSYMYMYMYSRVSFTCRASLGAHLPSFAHPFGWRQLSLDFFTCTTCTILPFKNHIQLIEQFAYVQHMYIF